MNKMALDSMPAISAKTFEDQLETLRISGFDGVQFADRATPEELAACRQAGMGVAGSGRINLPSEAEQVAATMASDGYECVTLHVGWGLENDEQADALIESILRASAREDLPLYIETHRATICQDMWRTVEYVKRFPEMRFNGDFSHWYAGQEMVYGGFDRKFSFIEPVIERVRFLHGRIASPGCMQVPVDVGQSHAPLYVEHFRQMWTACFRACLTAQNAESICFTPELLGPDIYYARLFKGSEESDRWEQSLILKKIAEECFESAHSC